MIKVFTLGFLIVSLFVGGYLLTIKNKNITNDTHLATSFRLGVVNTCRKTPGFIHTLSMKQPAIDSKQQDHQGGLVIRDMSNNRAWQDETWTKAGYLAGFDRDNKGNMYVAPLPYVSLSQNPPDLQNQIYKIDSSTAKMQLYLKMPSEEKPNNKNPFGTMGLFYDCDTNSLYVSSLAGSLPRKENGAIYQIDLSTNTVVSQFNTIDAIGIGVFNTLKGKRLYYGLARKPHIYSILLDEKGNFTESKRFEFSLSRLQGGDTTVAKKIQFSKKANKFYMTVKETEFGFRLLAENNPERKKYHFIYSIADDKWSYVEHSYE
jgi:hypothetical protein